MKRNAVETVMGAVVLVVAALFLFFAYTTSEVRAVSGYELTARFDRVGSLRNGADVRISGIKVGTVLQQTLDPKTFTALVRMSVQPDIKLPVDTVAAITSSGLLGSDFLVLDPGNEDEMLKPGAMIAHTQPPMDLSSLIGQAIFSGGGVGTKKPAPPSTGPAPGAAPTPKP
ncbi:MAG TPA: outer membrane lipid asymmetry maintenance protein MlaD [Stellaceae bacterium]|jgi:phospholipid/cholesterol/gamma-HCH transport system substrate-binding protein|nr:outer membrane lipid asymmetry maintenance protein MlaD [Stellaceae bacterium]